MNSWISPSQAKWRSDPAWMDTYRFICHRIGWDEAFVGPADFSSDYQKVLGYAGIRCGFSGAVGWIVWHKGYDGYLRSDLKAEILEEFVPVFTNDVFIVFKKRNIPSIPLQMAAEGLHRVARVLRGLGNKTMERGTRRQVRSVSEYCDAANPGFGVATAAIVTTFNRPAALARSLPGILALGIPVLVVDDGSDAVHRGEYDALLAHHACPHLSLLRLPRNGGVAAAVNAGIFSFLCNPGIAWISVFQDDVEVRADLLQILQRVQHPLLRPLVTGRLAPQHPVIGDQWINGVHVLAQTSGSGQHLHAHRGYWEDVLPVPTLFHGAPRNGRGSEFDWWITATSPGSVRHRGLALTCVPGLVRTFLSRPEESTWGFSMEADPALPPARTEWL